MKKFFVDQNLFAFIYCLFGVILLIHPMAVGRAVCYIIGACAVVYGGFRIYGYWKAREMAGFFRVDLLTGVVLLIVGLVAFLKPELLISILPAVLGLVILMDGFVTMNQAWNLRKCSRSEWAYLMGVGVCIGVLGVILVVNPFGTAVVMMRFLGITLLVDGISDLWWYYGLKKYFQK
jgi:uncharacterized membrane protein HdeD (DUF308 family)